MSTHERVVRDGNVVRAETEVRATPEQAWEAIATSGGLARWFVRAELEPREGGEIVTHHGAFGAVRGTITAWDPPRRLAYEEPDWHPDEDVPPWATELTVEARRGGTCVVRLVSGVFGQDRDWSDEVADTVGGWRAALRNLRLSFAHFPDAPAATAMVHAPMEGAGQDAAATLFDALGLADAAEGDRVAVPAGATPPLAAGVVVERSATTVVLRAERPTPGLVEFGASAWGGVVMAMVRLHLFGAGCADALATAEDAWRAWLAPRFPVPSSA